MFANILLLYIFIKIPSKIMEASMKRISLILCLFFLLFSSNVFGQETKTLFSDSANFSFAWGVDLKVNSMQNETGTLIGGYMGALVNKTYIMALAWGLNVGHPDINYGYLGVLGHYTYQPHELIHLSGQLLLAGGSTKDYEQKKTSTMDNFGNITGPGFFIIEPAILAEANLTEKTKFVLGLGYRMVSGLDEDDELIAITNVTNKDLSGLNLLMGVKVALY